MAALPWRQIHGQTVQFELPDLAGAALVRASSNVLVVSVDDDDGVPVLEVDGVLP